MTGAGGGISRRQGRRAGDGNPHVRALSDVLLAVVPLLFVVVMAWSVLHARFSALDFRYAYWSAGHRVLDGESPYIWTLAQFHRGVAFVYPPLSALIAAPAALFSRATGALVLTIAGILVAPLTLALMQVRDWRVYTVALAWLPVCAGWLTANESLFMALGLAGVWVWREKPGRAGFLTAVMLALKPLLWPLAIWFLATRRWRAAAHTLIWSVALNTAAFAVVGFGEISRYLQAVTADTDQAWRLGFGVPALLGHLGADRGTGIAVMIAICAGLVVALVHSGFVRHNELRALTLALALAIVSSPLVWGHYLAILLVPLALLRPRLNWLWWLPVTMWVCPPDVQAQLWQVVVFWVTGGLMLMGMLRQSAGPPPAYADPPGASSIEMYV